MLKDRLLEIALKMRENDKIRAVEITPVTEDKRETIGKEKNTAPVKARYKPLLPLPMDSYTPMDSSQSQGNVDRDAQSIAQRKADLRLIPNKGIMNGSESMTKFGTSPLLCETCYAAERCPAYGVGLVCAFEEGIFHFESRDAEQVMKNIIGLIELYGKRVNRAVFFETLDGGMPGRDTTQLIDGLIQHQQVLLQMKAELEQARNTGAKSITVSATGEGATDALMQIFAGAGKIAKEVREAEEKMPNFAPLHNPQSFEDEMRKAEESDRAKMREELNPKSQSMPDIEVS